jgi:hypothetical protein
MLPDWIELCKLLSDHHADYLLVGGQAVIAHGYPRLTKDIDLWVRPTVDNGSRVLAALSAFGVGTEGRVDILTHIPGVTFEDAWGARIHVIVDEVELPVIGKAHLIENKRAVGRLQDLADVEELEKLDAS